ncbi:MAG: sugar phosphate nucleotidyltransferase [Candidatus Woesearchaeota archaeon]
MKAKISITINEKTLKDIDSIIDNIYIRNRSQAIEHLVRISLGENKAGVVLAGGDERLLRLSDGSYRVTAMLKGHSVIERAVKKMRDNGFKTVYVVARHDVLTNVFNLLKDGTEYGVRVNYVEEKKSLGTAASLRALRGRINSSFLVVYGDVVFDKINVDELWNDHLKHNAITTIMLTTSNRPSEKGTVKVEGTKVLEFTQKPRASDIYLVFSPIFVASKELLDQPGDSLERDVFPNLALKGLLNGHLSSEKEFHIHNVEDLSKWQK